MNKATAPTAQFLSVCLGVLLSLPSCAPTSTIQEYANETSIEAGVIREKAREMTQDANSRDAGLASDRPPVKEAPSEDFNNRVEKPLERQKERNLEHLEDPGEARNETKETTLPSEENPIASEYTETPSIEGADASSPPEFLGERLPENLPKEAPPEVVCQPESTRKCYDGPPDTVGVGSCQAGRQTCTSLGQWSDCLGKSLPKTETCNGKDDDCDGKIDEGYDTKGQPCSVGQGGCFRQGSYRCDASGQALECSVQAGIPSGETCNGKDDDCDGKIDETYLDKGLVCYVGAGTCVRSATFVCTNDGFGLTCPVKAGIPAIELCDGVDNDCDGFIDEELSCLRCATGATRACYTGLFGTLGVGICKAGTQTCINGAWGTCTGDTTPRAELCDGTDRDCDGSVASIASTSDPCVTTVVGTGFVRYRDGSATTAYFSGPSGLAFHPSGALYVSEAYNHRIRKIDPFGNVTTFAGNGTPGFKDGPATTAQFNGPRKIAFDLNENLYIAGGHDHSIRKIDPFGNVTTFAGNGTPGFKDGIAKSATFNFPISLAFDRYGRIYVADYGNHSIRKIGVAGQVTTFAGIGRAGYNNGAASRAQFDGPTDLVFDKAGNLYIADQGNHSIRKIDTKGNVTTYAGKTHLGYLDGHVSVALFSSPRALAFDSKGNLYVADYGNERIRKIDTSGNVTTIAGDGTRGYLDGLAKSAKFNIIENLAFDSTDHLYVSDYWNHRIRKIDTSGKVTTLAGSVQDTNKSRPATNAVVYGDLDLAFDSKGNLYICMKDDNRIYKVDTSGVFSPFAGNGTRGYKDGPASLAMFRYPAGIAFDSKDNLYVADAGNHRIRKIDTSGNVTTFAGDGTENYKDGPPSSAQFDSLADLAFDSKGNLYATDFRARIRKIDPFGNVTTFAGSGFGYRDGSLSTALFYGPCGLVFDKADNLYITDLNNFRIRKIDTNGNVTTIAGSGTRGNKDGLGTAAQFNYPVRLALDQAGNLYVTDYNNNIRKIDTNGNVTTLTGSTSGFRDGPASIALFANPLDLAFDSKGNLYVTDGENIRIRKILFAP